MRAAFVPLACSVLLAGCGTITYSKCHPVNFKHQEDCDGPATPIQSLFGQQSWEKCEATDAKTGCVATIVAQSNPHFGQTSEQFGVPTLDLTDKYAWRVGEWRCPNGIPRGRFARWRMDRYFQHISLGWRWGPADVLTPFDSDQCDENTPLPSAPHG